MAKSDHHYFRLTDFATETSKLQLNKHVSGNFLDYFENKLVSFLYVRIMIRQTVEKNLVNFIFFILYE